MPDRALPDPADPEVTRAALRRHMSAALSGLEFEYDEDRTIYVRLHATRSSGETDTYLLRLSFLYYPEYPPSVAFVNPETKAYDSSHWPAVSGAPRLAFYANYGDAPAGMVCNSMTFEYYFWGGHSPAPAISWNKERHTFAATIAEIQDHLRPPIYTGRQS